MLMWQLIDMPPIKWSSTQHNINGNDLEKNYNQDDRQLGNNNVLNINQWACDKAQYVLHKMWSTCHVFYSQALFSEILLSESSTIWEKLMSS